jgi:putative FmdB family regulatory protein
MIYEYNCAACETSVEKIRKMSEREDPLVCECGANMLPIITGGAGFSIQGSGVASPGYKHNGPKMKFKRGRPVGPLDSRSKAFEKNKDEKASTYYGPGQGSWLAQDTVRRDEHNTKKEQHGL